MNTKDWLQRWQENRIGFHRNEVHPQLVRYWSHCALAKGCHVFVPLCGKSLDLLWLGQQGYRVTGVEISPIAVQAFFQENQLACEVESFGEFQRYRAGTIKILCGDFFALQADMLPKVQGIYDRAALIALDRDLRQRYVEKLKTLFPTPPAILLITLDYPQQAKSGPPFAVPTAEVETLYQPEWRLEQLSRRDLRELEKKDQLPFFEELVFCLQGAGAKQTQ